MHQWSAGEVFGVAGLVACGFFLGLFLYDWLFSNKDIPGADFVARMDRVVEDTAGTLAGLRGQVAALTEDLGESRMVVQYWRLRYEQEMADHLKTRNRLMTMEDIWCFSELSADEPVNKDGRADDPCDDKKCPCGGA